MRTSRLQVTLREVSPPVVRVLDVPTAATLAEVHELLQAGLGWTDSHLHEFTAGDQRFGPRDVDCDDGPGEPLREETAATLPDLGAGRWTYLYDFGDGWTHDVEPLGRGGDRPGCVDGAGGCPPEDCGGPHGYAELREILADSTHEDYRQLRDWVGGELPGFDQAAADLRVQQAAGQTPGSVRLLLGQLDGGVRLTPGGRLPRALVRAVQAERPGWAFSERPAQREEDLPPLAMMHDLLRGVGLARLRHGVLSPTRAAGDELAALRRLRSWFGPDDGFHAILVGAALGVLGATGPATPAELAVPVFDYLGPDWATPDGTRPTVDDVTDHLRRDRPLLEALDLIEGEGPRWRPGRSACWLLPRAAGLVDYWTAHSERAPEPAGVQGP